MSFSAEEKIKARILDALKKAGISHEGEILLEHPEEEKFGDFSTNIAMKLAKELKRNPFDIANEITVKILKNDFLEKVEAVKPGFINFFLSYKYLITELGEIIKTGDDYGQNESMRGKKIMVEFAHPNTHKMFHIGHLRNATTGECLVRLLEANGAKAIRANYEGDVGLHIAKCLYAIISNLKTQILNPNLKSQNYTVHLEKHYRAVKDKVEYLGKMYAEGNAAYENDEKAKEEILRINKLIYKVTEKSFRSGEHQDDEEGMVYQLWKETRQWSLDYFETIYKRLFTHFDRYYFESEVWERGKEMVIKGLEKGIFQASEGAVIFPGEKSGTHTRVFITKEGNVTYEGKDMGLGELQFKEHDPDLIIHCVGPEQTGYFQVMFQALEQLFPDKKGKEKHVAYGWVKLKHGKMSSREGNVVLGEWLLDEAKTRVEKIMEEGERGVETYHGTSLQDDIAEKTAVAAVKYSFLKVTLPSEIAFDFEESINFQGDSGPYLQYTFARTQSVLSKAPNFKFQIPNNFPNSNLQKEEISLLRWLYRFPETVRGAGEKYAPNLICGYLFELAQRYNLFYNKLPILKAETAERQNFRLELTRASGIIIKNGLNILGIEAPEKM